MSHPVRYIRLLASAIAIVTLAGLPTLGSDSPWLYGIHWFGPQTNASDVSQMTGGKKVWVLETVMTNDGAGQWGPQGQLANLQNTAALGHTLIIRIQPVWGKAFPLPGDTNPSMSTFLNQVTQTVTLYKDICHIWFLGNEMNFKSEWGDQNLLPETYIDAAVQFSDRVKAVAGSLGPQIVLVGPAAVGDDTDTNKFMGCTEYISRMCDRINNTNVQASFDGFAMHAYGFVNSSDLPTVLAHFETTPGEGYQYQLGLLDAKGFSTSPVYITEWNRYVGSTEGEYISATFLHTALERMNTWNQTHHPVVCACWYIYAISDPWWDGFSILKHKGSGDQDHDLWHSFQYAAGFNYPAGVVPTRPMIYRSPMTLTPTAYHGHNPANGSFTVRNAGTATLSYSISDDAGWLSTTPASGTSTDETDTISVIYNTAGLAVGSHQAIITIADSNAGDSPQTIAVSLQVKRFPGDADGDDDIDQTDFGYLQSCVTEPNVQPTPACLDADLDGDNDVDAGDVTRFILCMSGSNQPANLNCLPAN